MRIALRSKGSAPRTRVVSNRTVPPPVGGWNARDSLAAMKENEAVTLLNWFPKTSYVEIRGGYASHATGMTGNGKTLAVYNAMNGTNTMWCATPSQVYNVSSAGAVGASVAARTDGKHQWTMFGDGTSNWLIMCNGVDKPLYYDGTTWTAVDGASTPALTGITTTNLIGVSVFKGRLFFIQKQSLSFWYLNAGVAGGALTEFDLSAESTMGGYLMAMAHWTIDGGAGPEDRAVFITSEGEAIVYAGNNPSNAAAWSKVGVYYLGKPLGRRCVMQYGGDLVILTENGTYPLSAAVQSAAIDYKSALSFLIEDAFTTAARSYASNFGWESLVLPRQSAMIVNIPVSEGGEHKQYVMNTITKKWCEFDSWNAETFVVFNDELYYANGTTVYKAWSGTIDGTDNIVAYGKQAFSNLGSSDPKKLSMYRPILAVNGSLSFLADIDIDFDDHELTGVATYSVQSGTLWDAAIWDQSFWASGSQIVKEWQSPAEWEGIWIAGKIKIATNTRTVQWMASDYVWERANNPMG